MSTYSKLQLRQYITTELIHRLNVGPAQRQLDVQPALACVGQTEGAPSALAILPPVALELAVSADRRGRMGRQPSVGRNGVLWMMSNIYGA